MNNIIFIILIIICFSWILLILILCQFYAIPKLLFKKNPKNLNKNIIEEIIKNNELQFESRYQGKIGSVFLRSETVNIKIYKDVIILKLFMYPPIYLYKNEINKISDYKTVMHTGIKIEHSSEIIQNPIILYLRNTDMIKKLLL